jgi:hypothetical protein
MHHTQSDQVIDQVMMIVCAEGCPGASAVVTSQVLPAAIA